MGALSDKHGRKRILIISPIGSAVGYALFAYAIADISDKANKVKNFGLVGMTFGLGFIIGPFIGGKLTDTNLVSWFTYTTPFWAAAVLIINLPIVLASITIFGTAIYFTIAFKENNDDKEQ